jgi:hypothetical protein
MFALTVLTLGVFLLRARYPDDTADVVISSPQRATATS